MDKSDAIIIGIDEAGRGPLAGPVSAGAVILPEKFPSEILADSKKLSERKREAAEAVIREKAMFGTGLASHLEIDELNILRAAFLSMSRALEELLSKPEVSRLIENRHVRVMIDGNKIPPEMKTSYPEFEFEAVVKGDSKIHEIMAASILAKTMRDRIMYDAARLYPEYGYDKHKGYPTASHREICRKIGPSPIQRLTFKY